MWVVDTFKSLLYPFRCLGQVLILFYKSCISPLLPHTCRFYPSCSTYAYLAIGEFGLIKGGWLALKRLCRCRPNGQCGEDFVPINIKGDYKWIF